MTNLKKDIVLLSDSRIRGVHARDNDERCVDLLDGQDGLKVDRSRKQIGNQTAYFACVRKGVALRLIEAQKNLPDGLRLLIKEGFRPKSLQVVYYERYLKKISSLHPEWTPARLAETAAAYVAPPDLAPHSTGGAVDLTLIDHNETELDMGSVFNADPLATNYATYTHAPQIASDARRNRALLSDSLRKVGFVNYPTEWWHWSYGDRYWAYIKNMGTAIYDGMEAPRFQPE